ncbi:MAG TPA: ABC transporter permease [Conexibacter sp.]|nr:ABC transporter permease [Conexibacter sp.]
MSAVAAPEQRRRARFSLSPDAWTVEQRQLPPHGIRAVIFGGSILGAVLIGAVLLASAGYAPLDVYRQMLDSSFGSSLAFSQTLIVTTPLILTSLAAAVAYKVRVYTVGADGQLVVGAIFGSGAALALGGGLPAALTIPLALAAAIVGGALWASIAGFARAYLNADVIISTLMLNFIAIGLMNYLVLNTMSFWRDPASAGQPAGKPTPHSALLPHLFQQADVGIFVAIAVAALIWLLVHHTRWGFELRVVGDSPRAAGYAGISVRRKILAVLCLSGALAGLAGGIQVTNVTQALDPTGLDPGLGLGYAGIVVATLARLNLLACVPVSLMIGALLNAGPALEVAGVPTAVVVVLQGTILLLVTGSQFFLSYRIRRVGAQEEAGRS